MKKIGVTAIVAFALLAGQAFAQSSPNLQYGQVPTAAQWNGYFAAKQDNLGYRPVNKAGDQMLGPLKVVQSGSAYAGFNIPAGTAPASPNDGDMWTTSAGLFVRAGGVTQGPIGGVLPCASLPALTGDVTTPGSSCATTLATVLASKGGTGRATLTANAVLTGNGTSPLNMIAPNASSTRSYLGSASSGAPAYSQVNFSELLGSLDPSQCPRAASAGPVGCIFAPGNPPAPHHFLTGYNGTVWIDAQPSTADVSGLGSAAAKNTGSSVADPGTGALETLLPYKATLVAANKTFGASDIQFSYRRSNAGSAMADTFPASGTSGLANGALIYVANADTTATDTITAGTGTTFTAGATVGIGPGRAALFVYDTTPGTPTWRTRDNGLTALLMSTLVGTNILIKSDGGGGTAAFSGSGPCPAGTFPSSIDNTGGFTCTSFPLAGSYFANQGGVNQVLHGNASGNPTWGAVDLSTAQVTNNLTVGNGGLGVATLASNGILYGNGASPVNVLAVNATATKKYLQQLSSGAPSWQQIAFPDISGTVASAQLPAATNGAIGAMFSPANPPVAHQFIYGYNGAVWLSAPPDWTDITSPPTTIAGYGITNGVVTTNNGSDFTNFATFRSNVGLAIGSQVQAWNSNLDCYSALSGTGLVHRTGAGVCAAGAADLTSDVSNVLPSANGGTNSQFVNIIGPASSAKTFTLPNANATILTDNAPVTIAQGGCNGTTAATCLSNIAGAPLASPTFTGKITTPQFLEAGNLSAAAWGTAGLGLVLNAQTMTDTSSSGTVASVIAHRFNADVFAASSTTVYTNAYGVDFEPPTAGSNVTLSNSYAIRVNGSIALAATNAALTGFTASGPQIINQNASATAPTLIPSRADATTGIGAQATGNLSLIVAGVETGRYDATGLILFKDIKTSGTAPALSGCGTSPSIASGSTDTAGEVTEGTVATGCVITFASAKTNAPFCVVTTQTTLALFNFALSPTAITITNTSGSGDKIDYHCVQH